jgi:hypothetical protein
MGIAYTFEPPENAAGTLVIAEDDVASLADWLTDSMRLAGSGGEWSGGAPWRGIGPAEVIRAWLHDPASADPPVRGFEVVLTDEGASLGLIVGTARRWRDDLRDAMAGVYAEGVAPSGHIVR